MVSSCKFRFFIPRNRCVETVIQTLSGGQKASQSLRPNNVWCSRLHLFRFISFCLTFAFPNRSFCNHFHKRPRNGYKGLSRAFICISLKFISNWIWTTKKGRTDKTSDVFLQHKIRSICSPEVSWFAVSYCSLRPVGFLCGLSQYGFCQV